MTENKGIYQASLPVVEREVSKKLTGRDKRRANELDGATWTKYSISIWSDIKKSTEETELGHPAIFPIALVTRIIRCFTNNTDKTVLDPFAGIGSTAIAAEGLGKTGIGLEISPEFADKAKTRPCSQNMFDGGPLGERRIYNADANYLLDFVEPNSVDLVVTSPPYWDILLQRRTADNKAVRHYGNELADLGKIRDYKESLTALSRVFRVVCSSSEPKQMMWA